MIEYSQFKLWTGQDNREVIISSHGGRSLLGGRSIRTGFSKKKVPPGTKLAFYGPDRAVLSASSIKYEFIVNNLAAQPCKVKLPGDEYVDYKLTKYQGYHGSAVEDYDLVVSCLTPAVPPPHQSRCFDVVTIRHRPLKHGGSIMLSDLLKILSDNGHVYDMVHCSFCRCFNSDFLSSLKGRDVHITPTR